jgi:SPP1 gp7 family putative phage head morphogenesis protein
MPRRQNNGLDSVASLTVDTLRLAASHLLAPLRVLRELSSSLVGWIRSTARTINRVSRLSEILAGARLAIRDSYSLISTTHRKELKEFASAARDGARSVLASLAGADIFRVSMTAPDARAIADAKLLFGNSVADSWARAAAGLQAEFQRTVQQGIFLNETATRLTERIEGTPEAGFADGIMKKRYREAEAIVNTAAVAVGNAVRAEAYETSDDVTILTWSAILDAKTCLVCAGYHGKSWTMEGRKPIGHKLAWPGYLAHMRCRCSQIPGVRTKSDKAIREALDLDVGEDELAAAVDTVQENLDKQKEMPGSFDEWLAGKSHDYVNKLLGPGRAKLWEKGMPLEQMLTQTGRPLTLEQLNAKWSGERQRSNRDFIGLIAALAKKEREKRK